MNDDYHSSGRKPGAGTRVALVTGAARGIGAATAIALAKRGIATVLAVRDRAAARPVLEAISGLGQPCRIETCDITSHAAVTDAVQRVLVDWQRLDIVVNNAGQIDPIAHLGETDPAEWARAVSVNLVGAYHVVHASLPALLASPVATVLNVSSGAAHAPREGWSAYCSSKAGLHMLSLAIAEEYGARGIAAYSLQPGVVDTGMQVLIRQSGMNEVSRIPRENLAAPALSAGVIAWLCDARPAHHRGKDLSVRDASLMKEANAEN